MKHLTLISVFLCLFGTILAEVYLDEKFTDDTWEKNWIYSQHPGKEFGKFILTAGKYYKDESDGKGLKTSEDARFYAASRRFTAFTNKDKNLIIQFTVKHEQDIDCGGGYVKVFDCKLNQEDMHGESPYEIMFGPDICGHGTKKVHAIFNYKGKNHLIRKDIRCKDDVYTHAYTLIVKPDNTYEVQIDGERVEGGELEDDWDFLPLKEINDPDAKKPEDWVDDATIPDPEDKKPEDWDKPEHIPDPDATKPDDWDDEMDGEWEPPMIDNPEYKGKWSAKQIPNPDYKGPWIHPKVPNPEYKPDSELYLHKEICTIGLDLWQVKSGSIFDNILVTDDIETAKAALSNLKAIQDTEKSLKEAADKVEEEKRKKDSETEGDKDEEDDEDDDDDEDEKEEDNAVPDAAEEEHDEL